MAAGAAGGAWGDDVRGGGAATYVVAGRRRARWRAGDAVPQGGRMASFVGVTGDSGSVPLACERIHKPQMPQARTHTPPKHIAESTVRRLSFYLRLLEEFEAAGCTTVASDALAGRAGTTSAQVRKDLSFFGSFGKRGLGYDVHELARRLREILGLGRDWRVIIIGAGQIGGALARYRAFAQRGFHITAIYDSDPARIGSRIAGVSVRDVAELERDSAGAPADIAVLTVPADVAQAVLDRATAAGIRAIMNFAPVQLRVPDGVTLRNVNMAMELEALSFALTNEE